MSFRFMSQFLHLPHANYQLCGTDRVLFVTVVAHLLLLPVTSRVAYTTVAVTWHGGFMFWVAYLD